MPKPSPQQIEENKAKWGYSATAHSGSRRPDRASILPPPSVESRPVEGLGHHLDGRVQPGPLAQLLRGLIDEHPFARDRAPPRDAASRSSRVSGGS